MRKALLILFFLTGIAVEVFADYFKWEVLIYAEGYGTTGKTIPVAAEGKIQSFGKKGECRMEQFWTRIEADLLLEGKTLICVSEDKEQAVSVICSDNHRNRKYNIAKELYPISKDGFRIAPKLEADSPYLELRCYF